MSLRVPVLAGVREVARRAAARPEHARFDPIVCVDDVGVAVGVVRVERLLLRLAADDRAGCSPHPAHPHTGEP